jgi:hypothetical protein
MPNLTPPEYRVKYEIYPEKAAVHETAEAIDASIHTMLASLGRIDWRALTALWAIPLAFTVFNLTPLQLLWAAFPAAMADSQAALVDYLDVMLLAKAVLVVAWQVTGWWVVVSCLRQGPRVDPGFGWGGPPLEITTTCR